MAQLEQTNHLSLEEDSHCVSDTLIVKTPDSLVLSLTANIMGLQSQLRH